MQEKNYKIFIFPIIAISIFTLILFAAGFAYYNSTLTMATSNYQVNLPLTTSLICTKTDCSTTITPAMMANTNTNATTAKGTSTCYMNCTCSGTQGAVCNYNVSLIQLGTAYTPSASLGTANEFTVKITGPSGCTAQNSSGTATQVNTQAKKVLSKCSLTVPAGGSISANVAAEFKWYNLNLDQTAHASKVYQYMLSTYDLLPSGYQQIEYIETQGAAYLNTGFKPDNNTSIELQVYTTSTTNVALYCARTGTNDSTYTAFLISGTTLRVDYNNGQNSIGTYSRGKSYIIKQDKNKVYVDGALVKTITAATYSTSYNMYLLASHTGETNITNIGNPARLYYAKIWDNGTIVRDLIPCTRTSDSTPGMYDLINGVFYPSISSTKFIAGPNV